jgi:general secretion pathway protein I
MSARRRFESTRGFTLMEVMVAVGILALGLTAIFSSQGQAIKVGTRAQHMNIAALMARCKMSELEEQVMKEGLPAVDDSGRDGCCEGAELEGFECE